MTAVFGFYHWSQSPCEPNILESMAVALEIIPADVFQLWDNDQGGMGCRGRANSARPANINDYLFVDQHSGDALAVVANARIDNKPELAEKLKLSEGELKGMGTAELILCAYKAWGESCCEHLLGDFVLAVWDGRSKSLLLGRDHIGIKPLFYSSCNGRFVFANDIAGVLAGLDNPTPLSRPAIASYLGQGELYSKKLTFFEDVKKLPPATTLIVSSGGDARERKYWRAEDVSPTRCGDMGEVVLRLRRLLESAVNCRLPSKGPVAAHLSGGLDSASVVALAARALADKAENLQTWSWMRSPVKDEERADPEWRLGQLVADFYNLQHHYTELDSTVLLKTWESDVLARNDSVNLWYEASVRDDVRTSGARVILSGWGGDQFISHGSYCAYAELFWSGNFSFVLTQFMSLARESNRPIWRMLGLCYRRIFRPVLPFHPVMMGRALRVNFLKFAKTSLIAKARDMRVDKRTFYRGFKTREMQLSYLNDGHLLNRLESWAVSANRAGLEYCYPLLDKRIVEFSLGLSPAMYCHKGMSRYLLRAAMGADLPDDVREQRGGSEPNRVGQLLPIIVEAVLKWREANAGQESALVEIEQVRGAVDGFSQLERAELELLTSQGQAILKSFLVVQLEQGAGL